MKVKSIKIDGFRRFHSLSIVDIPPARLVIMAGPNGSGKSSLFDAFASWQQARRFGVDWDPKYHGRGDSPQWAGQVKIEMDEVPNSSHAIYLRSAYRNDPDFQINTLHRMNDLANDERRLRMIDQDSTVSQNYERLASNAFEDAFERDDETKTLKDFREGAVGEIRSAVRRLFPDLDLNTLGNPLVEGTFRFNKGSINGFSYKCLSGGEKAAFDLLLDLLVKKRTFTDTIFGIDEPEAHMNTRLQGALLGELYNLIPNGSQLWVATHSIGMMRKAKELYLRDPNSVAFIDFEGHDFDQTVILRPIVPTRAFWERILRVALDDLADLVAPKEIIICEGNPRAPVPGKNEAHDAQCYQKIFGDQYLEVKFVSGGSSKDVLADRLRFAYVFTDIIKGVSVRKLIDRDDHSSDDVEEFRTMGISTLRRRHIESYLYDKEVLLALYEKNGRASDFADLVSAYDDAMRRSVSDRGNPPDDVKSAAGEIYAFIKRHLQLTGVGNDQLAFSRNILADLLRPGMTAYEELRQDIFG